MRWKLHVQCGVGENSEITSKSYLSLYYVKNNELYNLKKWTTLYSDRLIYNKERARDIVGTIMRLPKFLERGFEISNQEMATMLLKLHEVGFNDEELLMLRGKLGSISFGSGEWYQKGWLYFIFYNMEVLWWL